MLFLFLIVAFLISSDLLITFMNMDHSEVSLNVLHERGLCYNFSKFHPLKLV